MISKVKELWGYRELIRALVVRDLKLRYKNSVIGFMWSLVNPLLLMLVFTVVFTIMLPSNTITHFPVFVLTALFAWNFFNTAIMSGLRSIVDNGHLIKKVYFPREVLTLSIVLANFVNFALSIPVLLIFVACAGIPLTLSLLYIPLIMVMQVAFTMGVALFLAALQVYYRDTGHIMEVVIQAWFFLTPVFYPSTYVPEWRAVLGVMLPVRRLSYILNPMASIIASYRSVIYGNVNGSPPSAPAWDFFLRTGITCIVALVVGYWFFVRRSKGFGEEV